MPKEQSSARSPAPDDAEMTPPKRSAPPEGSTESAPRAKRGKYTSLACNECKRRKLKCVPLSQGSSCERCDTRRLDCVFAVNSPKPEKKREDGSQIQILGDELALVRQELASLSQAVHELKNQHRSPHSLATHPADHGSYSTRSPSNAASHGAAAAAAAAAPKDARFIGPTRPAYGLMIAERSLTRMGIPDSPSSPSGSGEGPASPSDEEAPSAQQQQQQQQGQQQQQRRRRHQHQQQQQQQQQPRLSSAMMALDAGEFWAQCTPAEAARLMGVFEDEVESMYPFIDITELASRSEEVLRLIRQPDLLLLRDDEDEGNYADHDRGGDDDDDAAAAAATTTTQHGSLPRLSATDVDIAKLAVAVGIAIEARGKNHLCAAIAASVEEYTTRISQTEVSLRGIQLLIMLVTSNYYFHCDDELLAWRTIGIAAREALEMGLHRKRSLYDNFADTASRQLALRVFCCCYMLDRRWSFGTSLSFALVDGDIDSDLLETELDSPYLKCMVGYARLCSKLWEAIPPFGSPNPSIPPSVAQALDASAQAWLDSIPPHLQMRHHPRALYSARSQPRVLHRLRALLYLRGNLTRVSIRQHHLLSAAAVAADPRAARLAVELAQDTVQVLVHLNATSDIYSRQQTAFNYFLASALAVISLAVCHAPAVFAAPCGQSLVDAVGLVRGFSRHCMASKRLWKSIRGLLPRLKSLGVGGGTKEQAGGASGGGGGSGGGDRKRSIDAAPAAPATGGAGANTGVSVIGWRAGQTGSGDLDGGGVVGNAVMAAGDAPWNNYSARRQDGMTGTGAPAGDDSELLPGMNPDILSLFDSLGDQPMFTGGGFDAGLYGGLEPDGDGGDISRLFLQGLM